MGSGVPRQEILSEMLDRIREGLAECGAMMLNDLLAAARARNPGLTIEAEQESIGRAGWERTVVRVSTERGDVIHRREASERWVDTFARAGLL